MAPRKRMLQEAEDGEKALTTTRLTRSSARLALQAGSVPEPPQKKKALKREKTKAVKAEKDAKARETVGANGTNSEREEVKEAQPLTSEERKEERTVIIEHCKQCNSFKTRALLVKNGLETGVSGITVLVNPDKPRRGCFEVREESGKKFISLLDMKRPFSPMKALNMEVVVSEIIDKLNGVK